MSLPMSLPNAVLPWSHNPLAMTIAAPTAVAADDCAIALALFSAGFVSAAIAIADASTDEELRAQAEGWRLTQSSDAALAEIIAAGGGALIPSVSTTADGAPRFVLRIPDTEAALSAIAAEHVADGADSELRLFLDEVLRDGDRFVDVAPGVGFAALSAACGAASVSVIALCDDAGQRFGIEESARWSNADGTLTAHDGVSLDQVALAPAVTGGATIVHAGSAAAVAPLLSGVRRALERGEIGAVAWRCGRADETGRDAEALQIAAAVLGVFGFQHFALAQGADGPELVPADAMASNEMVFSIEPTFLARFSA